MLAEGFVLYPVSSEESLKDFETRDLPLFMDIKKIIQVIYILGFPGDSDIKNLPTRQEIQVRSLGWKPTPLFLPGEFHGQRSLAGYSPWSRKELDTTEQLTHNIYSQKSRKFRQANKQTLSKASLGSCLWQCRVDQKGERVETRGW